MNNSSAASATFEQPSATGWIVAFGFVALLVCGSNVLILMAFTTKGLRRRSYYQVINLSIADLAVGIVVMPLFIRSTMSIIRTRTEQEAMWFADPFFGLGSFGILVVISCERYLAVSWPLKHRLLKGWHYATSLALPWVIAALVAALDLLLYDRLPFPLYLPVLSLGLLVIFISYTALWVKKNAAAGCQLEGRCRRMRQKNRKLATTLLITTLASLATWLPFYIYAIYVFACGQSCKSDDIARTLKLLQFTNSFVNGVIYSLRMQKFRGTIKGIFCCQTGRGLPILADATSLRSVRRTQQRDLTKTLAEHAL